MSANLSDPIALAVPIQREGADPIAVVTLRKPDVGALRGAKLADLLQMDVNAVVRVLPRMTSPALLPAEVEALDPQDLLTLAGSLLGFFAPDDPAQKARMGLH